MSACGTETADDLAVDDLSPMAARRLLRTLAARDGVVWVENVGRRERERQAKSDKPEKKAKAPLPPLSERPCAVCSASFMPVRRTQVYCSSKCRADGDRRTRRRYVERKTAAAAG